MDEGQGGTSTRDAVSRTESGKISDQGVNCRKQEGREIRGGGIAHAWRSLAAGWSREMGVNAGGPSEV